MLTFLITGANGQLGRALVSMFPASGTVVPCRRADLDITNAAQALAIVQQTRPSVIVNCAAFNDVDAAETQQERAFDVNAMAVRTLARAAQHVGAVLVHYSTDFVFDGTADHPYRESDAPSPQSVYAASKLVGEWMAVDAGRWYVLRIESLFGAAHTPGLARVGSIDRIIDGIGQGQPTKVFRDRVVSPSYVLDVATATERLIASRAPSGTYHAVNTGHCTWHQLAQEIAGIIGGAEHLVPIESAALGLKAPRPQFAALDNSRLASAAYPMPTWQDAIRRYLSFRQRPAAG